MTYRIALNSIAYNRKPTTAKTDRSVSCPRLCTLGMVYAATHSYPRLIMSVSSHTGLDQANPLPSIYLASLNNGPQLPVIHKFLTATRGKDSIVHSFFALPL